MGDKRILLNCDMQNAFASALVDQHEDLIASVKGHCRRLEA